MACDEFSKVLCGANHDPVAFRCRSLRCSPSDAHSVWREKLRARALAAC